MNLKKNLTRNEIIMQHYKETNIFQIILWKFLQNLRDFNRFCCFLGTQRNPSVFYTNK